MGAYSGGMFKDGQIVDAIYVHAIPYGTSSGSLAVYIGDAMTEFSKPGVLNPKPVGIDSSTLANTSECKPNINKKIVSRNWFIAQPPNFPYKHSMISYGALLKVRAIVNDDGIDFKLVSEEADPSFDP